MLVRSGACEAKHLLIRKLRWSPTTPGATQRQELLDISFLLFFAVFITLSSYGMHNIAILLVQFRRKKRPVIKNGELKLKSYMRVVFLWGL